MIELHDSDFIEFLGTQESQYIIKASEVTQEVLDRLSGKVQQTGDLLPWSKTHNCVALRPGEVSLWMGINGHGKSMFTGMVCAWGLQNKKWLIASMEMKPSATMYRMTRQIAGTRSVDPRYATQFMTWTDNRLWIYDQVDTVKPDRILGMVHYAAQELGINHIVIDSLIKCGIPKDRTEEQASFVDRLCWAAKSNDIHIHLVHHVRKGEKESQIPDKFDARGAAEVTDLVDNVFIAHRNKEKERKAQIEGVVDDSQPDCTLRVAKQRHGEWEGDFKFWFHADSMQYTADHRKMVIPFNMSESLRRPL